MLGRYSRSENWYWIGGTKADCRQGMVSDDIRPADSVATPARRTGITKAGDKRLGHLTLLGIRKNTDAKKPTEVGLVW